MEVNTNPYAITDIDPAIIFAGAQRTQIGTWNAEHTIVQQFVGPTTQVQIPVLISMPILTEIVILNGINHMQMELMGMRRR